jgi:hypothetical protein
LDSIRVLGSDPDSSGIEALRVGKVRKVTECRMVVLKQLYLKVARACSSVCGGGRREGPVTRVRVEMQVNITLDGQNKC